MQLVNTRASLSPRSEIGFTLLELLITLALITILIILSIPLLNSLQKSRADSAMHFLMREIQQARSTALSHGKTITLCGSNDDISCVKNWQDGMNLQVFIDNNKNRKRDEEELLIRSSTLPDGIYQWRGAGRNYLRFRRDGSVREMGTFTYCPPSKDASLARQLTINRPGRSYYSRDKNGDGVHEANTSTKPIACPDFD